MAKKQNNEQVKTVDSFGLKNVDLKHVHYFLDVPLHSEKAVARNRVLALVEEKFEAFQADRMVLVEKYGKRDKDDQLVKSEDGSRFLLKDEKTFANQYEILEQQEAIFDVLPSNRGYWKTVRDIIRDSKKELDIEQTDFYEEILEKLKAI